MCVLRGQGGCDLGDNVGSRGERLGAGVCGIGVVVYSLFFDISGLQIDQSKEYICCLCGELPIVYFVNVETLPFFSPRMPRLPRAFKTHSDVLSQIL